MDRERDSEGDTGVKRTGDTIARLHVCVSLWFENIYNKHLTECECSATIGFPASVITLTLVERFFAPDLRVPVRLPRSPRKHPSKHVFPTTLQESPAATHSRCTNQYPVRATAGLQAFALLCYTLRSIFFECCNGIISKGCFWSCPLLIHLM